MDDVTTAEARKNLADLLNRVAYLREPVQVTRRGKGVAVIMPVQDAGIAERLRQFLAQREVAAALDRLDENEAESWAQLKEELGL